MQDHELETAHHEAGHAVAALRLGVDGGSVTIEPDYDDGSLGRAFHAVVFTHLPPDHTPDDAQRSVEAVVVVALAGLEAQRLVNPECDPRGAARDEADVASLLERYGDPARLPALRERTRRFVAEHADEIARVARALLDLRTLEALEVEDAADGRPIVRTDWTARTRTTYADHLGG